MFVDNYVPNPTFNSHYDGGAVGEVESRGGISYDAGFRRPYLDKNGRMAVTVNTGRWTVEKGVKVPVKEHRLVRDMVNNGFMPPPMTTNATTLRKEEWTMLDTRVLRAARYRLRAWGDLAAASSYGGFNGMGKLILEHETMTDPGEALVDMDGLTEGRTDYPKFQLEGLPLPITHSDFFVDARKLIVSRNSGTPLDTNMGEASGRRIAESIEKVTIGNNTGVVYGGNSTQVGGYGRTAQVYGYTNFPNRVVYTTMPTPTGLNPDAILASVLAQRDALTAQKFYGPFMIYHSNDWDRYMDNDYARAVVGTNSIATELTLRQRILKIGKEDGDRGQSQIQGVRRLDFLFGTAPRANSGPGAENLVAGGGGTAGMNPFTLIWVQMTSDVCEAVNGMDITTLQWEMVGGMKVCFKVMAIQVPRLKADNYGNCFRGDTKFITRQGVRSLKEMVGQDVEVQNRHGQWEKATVQSFGTQRLQRINFEHLAPVYATAEHRWWQKDGRRVTTSQLREVPFTESPESVAKVTSIEDAGFSEEVFCCVVPGSESFTLANRLVTSNCGILHSTTA